MSELLERMGAGARAAARSLASATAGEKNAALECMARALLEREEAILAANRADAEAAAAGGMTKSLLDRLSLSPARVAGMAAGIREVAALADPVGEIVEGGRRPNGLRIQKTRVPLGVVGIIYEARPNVTSDAAALCLKAGNAVILRGGKEALRSNAAIADALRAGLEAAGQNPDAVQLIPDTSRETANAMMRLHGVIDVLIPRGGAGLIRAVVENATVPVIETGVGNCHIYVDRAADLSMAAAITVNAKASRPSVCNAAETLLVHADIAAQALPVIARGLKDAGVQLRGCERTREILNDPAVLPATEEDWAAEYLDYIMAVRVVPSLEAAVDHIAAYGTGHSECIVTDSHAAAEAFTARVDAAAVYVNASTRFTDGGEFGLGAEIGISTQKLHARGPMGLRELTTVKYIVYGDGQVR
ncbi:MAG TPA: glutamate-5-semialdehyde dehydrogenase [Firmicutes bacterium]|nr:glutamate-5-semialdehyde dehydrogenase [Bacillota bacterium]